MKQSRRRNPDKGLMVVENYKRFLARSSTNFLPYAEQLPLEYFSLVKYIKKKCLSD